MADLGSLLGSAGIGGAIGKAIVNLELDTKKYLAEMKAAEGQTVAGTNSMSSKLATFGGIAKTAFLGAGVAAVAFGAYAVKSAIEAADAQNKLANTFKNNKLLSDSSIKSFNDQAAALRDLTGVDDEAITVSQAMLGQFKITGAQVEELTPLIVDLSAKMGIDLAAATKSVGKAVIGNTAGLQRYGIVIDEAAGKGSEFDAVLKGLGGTVGGFAKQRAIDEPWRVLGAQFEEIAETVGEALLPAIRELAQTLTDNLPVIQAVIDKTSALLDIYKDIATISFAPWAAVGDVMGELGGKADELNLKFPELAKNLDEMQAKAGLAAEGITNLTGTMDHSEIAAVSVGTEWRGLSKAGKDIADGLRQELPNIIGTVTKYKDVFTLKPEDLAKISESWVKIGKTLVRDLREIAESDLTPTMKAAIAALPPELRHAWAESTAKQKAGFEADLRNALNLKATLDKEAAAAAGAAREVGRNIASGIALGITTSSELITVAAANAVHKAIDAANEAGKIHSPSEEMIKVGKALAEGLTKGILDNTQKAVDATKAMLDKVVGAASSFRSTVSGAVGGFGDFGSFTGEVPLSAFLQSQVGGASQLSDLLKTLKAGGASKGLISEAAANPALASTLLAGGPGAISDANQALKDIAALAKLTGKGLSEAFFGERIDRLGDKLDRQNEHLRDIEQAIRGLEHGHDVVLDGEKIAISVRTNLIKTGRRNDGTGIN